MVASCFLVFLWFATAYSVLLRDVEKIACDDYDLFDPPTHILRESDGSYASAEENHEELSHQLVHKLNLRTNSLFKSVLVQQTSSRAAGSGVHITTFYHVETRCRNNGKVTKSLIECPYREKGKVQECTVPLDGSAASLTNQLDRVSCKNARLGDVLKLPSDGDLEDLFSTESLQQKVGKSIRSIAEPTGKSRGAIYHILKKYNGETRKLLVWLKTPLVGFRIPTTQNFDCFKRRFGKAYADEEEHQHRFLQFHMNMKKAYLFQITEQGSGVYGPTQFSDLSVDEFRRTATGLRPSLRKGHLTKIASAPTISTDDIPDQFDWRDKNAVTPVKDQSQCGSCWAFSTTGNVEGQWAIKKGKLVSLSEQELVDCDKLDEGCSGGLPSNAYKSIIQLGGLERESDYPYDGRDDKCSFKKQKVVVYINDSVEISTNETDMAKWLVKNGPISIGINANAMMLYVGGVSHPWKVVCSPKSLDHGVLIVGYGQKGNKPFWIVKNSWGPGWGVKGYYLVYRGDGTCGLNLMCTSAVVL